MENENTTPEITPLESRRLEVAQYEQNIAMYKAIASSLPGEWPQRLIHLKGSSNQHADIATLEDLEDVELVSDLWAHDQATAAIRAETVEKRKAEAILAFLETQE